MAFRFNNISSKPSQWTKTKGLLGASPSWLDSLFTLPGLQENGLEFESFHFDHHRSPFDGSPPWLDSLFPLPGLQEHGLEFESFHFDHHRSPFDGSPPWLDSLSFPLSP